MRKRVETLNNEINIILTEKSHVVEIFWVIKINQSINRWLNQSNDSSWQLRSINQSIDRGCSEKLESSINQSIESDQTKPAEDQKYLQENAAVRVDIRPRVFRLALLQQNVRHNFVDLRNEFEHGILWEMFQREFTLARVARIGLPQHGVTVPWDHLRPK